MKAMKFLHINLILLAIAAGCSAPEKKVEKEVIVEMNTLNDSTAEATVTITEDSAGNKKEVIRVIKGHPKEVQVQVKEVK